MIARNKTIYLRRYIDIDDACDSKTNSTYQLENKTNTILKFKKNKHSHNKQTSNKQSKDKNQYFEVDNNCSNNDIRKLI